MLSKAELKKIDEEMKKKVREYKKALGRALVHAPPGDTKYFLCGSCFVVSQVDYLNSTVILTPILVPGEIQINHEALEHDGQTDKS